MLAIEITIHDTCVWIYEVTNVICIQLTLASEKKKKKVKRKKKKRLFWSYTDHIVLLEL